MSGHFITFEGGEGAGKSTQIKRLAKRLRKKAIEVVLTREPGGSFGAEAVRHVLLSGAAKPFGAEAEVMLFAAARLDHMQETILPALKRNAIVLCDRFYDSTRAYQGGGEGVSKELLTSLEKLAVKRRKPDATLILDIAPEKGLERVQGRLQSNKGKNLPQEMDRFEGDTLEIHKKRREAFLEIARNEPERCYVVNAEQEADIVSEVIWKLIEARFDILLPEEGLI